MASISGALVEREVELARLATAVEAVRAGTGRFVVVEGSAGVGKTSLLAAAAASAREAGCEVLSAAAGEFDCDLSYGVVRQLFETALYPLGAPERRSC